MPASVAKKPVRIPLFAKTFGEHRSRPVAEVPAAVGTLPPDVYIAWAALKANGPDCPAGLEQWLLRHRDWAHARVERAVKALLVCGYVRIDEEGVMTAREETR